MQRSRRDGEWVSALSGTTPSAAGIDCAWWCEGLRIAGYVEVGIAIRGAHSATRSIRGLTWAHGYGAAARSIRERSIDPGHVDRFLPSAAVPARFEAALPTSLQSPRRSGRARNRQPSRTPQANGNA